jgi:hypothetical protein
MKAIQAGILIALLICAVLLYKIYRTREAVPAPAVAALPAATPPPEAVSAKPQPTVAPQAAPTRRSKPTPSRRAPDVPPQMAENVPPPVPVPAPQQAPPLQPTPTPTPTPEPRVVLNPPPDAPPAPRQPHAATIPAGALIVVRLADSLSASNNKAGDSFSATLDQPLVADGFAIAERGAHVDGKVIDTGQGGKDLNLQLIKLHTSDGQDVPLSTERYTRAGDAASGKSSGEKVAGGAILGAVIGAIAGGGKGAAIGAGAGGAAGGGVAAATHRKPAQLPVETRLTFRLNQPVTLTERLQ